MNRRTFLKTTGAVGAGMGLTAAGGAGLMAAALADDAPNAEKLGWRLGCQAWTFRLFPLDEAIDKTASLGLHYIETCPGQKLSKDRPGVTFGYGLAGRRAGGGQEETGRLGRQLVSIGVVPLVKDVDNSRKTFDFAKEMGMETIVSEPAEDAFDTLEKLCRSIGSTWPSTIIPSPRTTGTPIPC